MDYSADAEALARESTTVHRNACGRYGVSTDKTALFSVERVSPWLDTATSHSTRVATEKPQPDVRWGFVLFWAPAPVIAAPNFLIAALKRLAFALGRFLS